MCTFCNAKLVGGSNSGTSHLLNHIKICPMRKQNDIRQHTLTNNKTNDGKDTLEPYTFDPIVVRRKLAEMIILHEYPLRMVEHDGFREYSATLQPLFKPVSRNIIKRHIMQIYDVEKEKEKTISVLEANRSRISITTDMWTSSHQKKGFMAVTAHFIDDSWAMQSRILRFIYVPCPHTAETLCEALNDCLMDWNIDHVFARLSVREKQYKIEILGTDCRLSLSDWLKSENEVIKEMAFKLGDENSIHSNSSLASQLEMPVNSSKRDERLLSYDLFVSSDDPTHVKSEFDAYLEEKVLPRTKDFDILVWWRANASKYPILAQIARDFLAIPVSSVASESAFSTAPTACDTSFQEENENVEEIIHENKIDEEGSKMPFLVYVSRERRASYPHRFKAGALNTLLRVSGIMSNGPYILVLDCDMYCNDPTSAREAMCFNFDPNISPSLAYVQFPQMFYNVNDNDIYEGGSRSAYMSMWQGMDGLRGPTLSGTGYYLKRISLFTTPDQQDKHLLQPEKNFGNSRMLIDSLKAKNDRDVAIRKEEYSSDSILEEAKRLASRAYEVNTNWGKEASIGYLYESLLETTFTGYILHCKGWISVYLYPQRPCFLGCSNIDMKDSMTQLMKWSSGLIDVGLSRFSPLIYGFSRMSILQSMCYAYFTFLPLFLVAMTLYGTVPQLCLLTGTPLYPKVIINLSL
ncbi:hypothetical protein EZV62_003063 [Acer yangbiense]|uniref:HAT C-terminal dimerisation domain-containing protein n=1 Tax=Acer yangbiense TaxID=1000413 RepID=A0A5C7IZZ3_9ROSI|nr:hypothetical protein EZV62_003063 [Acer yangbiense]